jgi:hypothetical protein
VRPNLSAVTGYHLEGVIVMKRASLLVLMMATLVGCGTAGPESVSTATPPAKPVTVGCDQIVGTVKTGHEAGYRVVLGVVSAPPAVLPGVVHVPKFSPFPYWRKAGMVIHASRKPVTISVPEAWRQHARIGWGNPASPTTVVRFAACPSPNTWNAYAGGFFLRTRSACVPLVFSVSDRRVTLRFGLGRNC